MTAKNCNGVMLKESGDANLNHILMLYSIA